MFKAIVCEHYGPSCGQGGYGTQRGVAFSRSPKRALVLARQRMWDDQSQPDPVSGHVGGGVPILGTTMLWAGSKLILNEF